jgi:hypothetical protein
MGIPHPFADSDPAVACGQNKEIRVVIALALIAGFPYHKHADKVGDPENIG